MARKTKPDDPAIAVGDRDRHIPAGPPVDRETLMPGYRPRRDGWTQERTQRFFDTLRHTGCARDAARVAGLSNQAAYRMRERFPAFSAAWDAAIAQSQPALIALAYARATEGRETIIIRKGEEYERRIAPSDAMLTMLVKRGDLKNGEMQLPEGTMIVRPEECVTRAEAEAGAYWSHSGGGIMIKVSAEEANATRARLLARFETIHARLLAEPDAAP